MYPTGSNNEYCGPIPWWTLSGTLERSEICRQLDEMCDRHIREVILYANYGLEKPDFLTDEWFDTIGVIVEELSKRNMACWIYDELSWPSGSAGGRLPRDYPQYRMRCLNRDEFLLAPGESITLPDNENIRSCGWFDPGSEIATELPAGTIFTNTTGTPVKVFVLEVKLVKSVFFHNIGTSGTWNQEGTLDTLNPDAVRCWMGYIHIKYQERFQKHFGSIIKGFFFDEPTMTAVDRTNTVPWTFDLEEAFFQKYQYDCRPLYWQLFYETQTPEARQFRYDFWRLAGYRFADAFAKQLADWCDSNNLKLTGHGWPEEPSCQRLMMNETGDLHYQQQHLQVPGTDYLELKNCFSDKTAMGGNDPRWARNYIYSLKHVSSTARYNGARRTLAETSGICSFVSPLSSQRFCYDFLFAMGINIINSAVGFSLKDFRKYACCAERFMPYWKYYKEFSDYIARCSYFNTQGLPDARIAVLNPVSSKFAQSIIAPDTSMRNEKTPFAPGADSAEATLAVLDSLVRGHREFELIFEDVLLEGKCSNGSLELSRAAFQIIILPQAQVLDDQVAVKLAEFTAAGGKVIAVGSTPQSCVKRTTQAVSVDINCTYTHHLDYQTEEFQKTFLQLLEELCPEKFALTGDQSEYVITQHRSQGDWHGLFLYNGTSGAKSVNLDHRQLPEPSAIVDPGDGVYYQPQRNGNITLQDGQSLIVLWDKTLSQNLPPIERAPWYPAANAYTLPLKWQIIGDFANTMRPELEVLQQNVWQKIENTGYLNQSADPDKEPFLTLRGTFCVADTVPEDLRLRFDSANYNNLTVNNKAVTALPRQETVFDPTNAAVNIAEYCQVGTNNFIVTVPVNPWFSDRYGIRRHFVGLTKLLELIPLAGSFALDAQRRLIALPDVLRPGDLTVQGLAEFMNRLELQTTFDLPEKLLTSQVLHCSHIPHTAEVTINGVKLPAKLWGYGGFTLPAGVLKSSANTMHLVLTQTPGNLYRRRWNGGLTPPMPFTLPEFSLS